jgi:hypothetical protein
MIPEIKYTTWGSKKSVTLKLNEEQFSQIKHLFNEQGQPISKDLDFNYNGYKWTIGRTKNVVVVEGKETNRYSLFGTCGDSTFGSVPWYFRQQYYGNIRAGKEILEKFIEKYFINQNVIYEIY